MNLRPAAAACVVLLAILATGLVVFLHNADLPIVRNALMYGRAARAMIDHGYDPRPVIADNKLNYGKPFLFAWSSAPLVERFGVNVGLKLSSFLGTALFAVAAFCFFAVARRRLDIPPGWAWVGFALTFFNPLAIYQFWSAYPDGLFSALVVFAFLLSERLARGETRAAWTVCLVLAFVIYAAVVTKLYGLILGLACPLVIAWGWWQVRPARAQLIRLVPPLVIVFGVLGALVLGAREGLNPTLVLGSRGGNEHSMGFSELESSLEGPIIFPTLLVFSAWIVGAWLCFGPTLLFLAWRPSERRWPSTWCVFFFLFLAGLLPFGVDIIYNLRYILPILPFVGLAIAGGMARCPRRTLVHGILALQGGLALATTLYFNSRPVYERWRDLDQRFISPVLDQGRRLDNLRMEHHLLQARQIECLNREVEPGGIVYWGSTYGRNANHEIIEEMGIRPDIELRYDRLHPTRVRGLGAVYATQDVRYPDATAKWHRKFSGELLVTALGDQVIRLSPLIELSVTRRVDGESGQAVEVLRAEVPADTSREGASVEFRVDGKGIAVDWEPPFEASYGEGRPGRHVASAKLIHRDGVTAMAPNLAFYVGRDAFEISISRCRDDGEEAPGLAASLDSSDLEMCEDRSGWGEQLVALRFRNLPLAAGARVHGAYLQFTSFAGDSEDCELTIEAEAAGDSSPFSRAPGELAARPRVPMRIAWQPEPWPRSGERAGRTRSPELAGLVQAVIGQPGWQRGHALTFFVSGRGLRVARSCDGATEVWQEPTLFVELVPAGRGE